MKKKLLICIALLGFVFLTQNGKSQTTDNKDVVIKDVKYTSIKNSDSKTSIIYATYNGTATDDVNITGNNTLDEFHLFMKNDTQNIVYVISKLNYSLWTSKKIMPTKLQPLTQTYRIDVAAYEKLESQDNTVEFYEIIELNNIVETDEGY